ncbi:hypothetical protein MEX01_16790 [Methylorubrum extorquens]|nr:hypothetical protein MEX01_16790 [Methylorubrum extorquens]
MPVVLGAVLGGVRVDRHPANRVLDRPGVVGGSRTVTAATAVPLMAMHGMILAGRCCRAVAML